MGDLTEVEIFDCLATNCRQAAERADRLARSPRRGPNYVAYRDHLKLVEGACRQAGYFRDDARWFALGRQMAHAHAVAGEWLRGIKVKGSPVRVKLAEGHIHPLFCKMAENLRALHAKAEQMKNAATGRLGPILPRVQEGPHRDTRPVGWSATQSGLFVPTQGSA